MGHVEGFSMVICGDWICSNEGEWSFSVDKEMQSRVVPVCDGIILPALIEVVCSEFGVKNCVGVSLSYWAPTSLHLSTGKKTPPVMITTSVGLDYYLRLSHLNKGINLFVKFTFELKRRSECTVDAEIQTQTSSGVIRNRPLVEDDTCGYVSTAGSKVPVSEDADYAAELRNSKAVPLIVETVEFVKEMEKVDSTLGYGRCPIVSEVDDSDTCQCDGNSPCSCIHIPDDVEISAQGYDKEFWANFIEDDFGGSNAVEVMCSSKENLDQTIHLDESEEQSLDGINNTHTSPHIDDGIDNQRKLADIDDEEFDIPLLFDDTEFEIDEIPDLEKDYGDFLYKGKLFASKEDCQIWCAIFAINNMFHFTQTRTQRYSFELNCPDSRCDWRVTAHEIKESGYYQIRKAQLQHRCSVETRKLYMKKATCHVLAAVYKAKYGEPNNGPTPIELQKLILEDLRVSASYRKCWRAREKAQEKVQGGDEDAFSNLAEHLYLLKIANPGTVTDIVTDIEEDGSERFLYMFLAFGASIEGFKNLRRMLVVDGTHLNGKYKGVLLTASGQDANFQVFPLAFAVVDSENDNAWTWFFQKVERIIADSPSLTIISDRNQSIYTAKSRVFPLAHHGACIVHIARNVLAKFKNKGLSKMVVNAGCAFKIPAFNKIFQNIKSRNNECGTYLANIGMAHWTRAYFRGDRYNLMTSNISEVLNKALSGGRSSPIVELLKFIRSMLTRWFSARRKKSAKNRELVPPYVDKVMTKHMSSVKCSKIANVSNWSYEIVGLFGEKHHVLLDDKRCNCKVYDKIKIPCGHALLAADAKGVPYGTLVGDCYKNSSWVATYKGVVSPEADIDDIEIPADILDRDIRPPRARRPSGRPVTSRILSVGEFPKLKIARLTPNKCSRCKGTGHNRVRCTNPI